MVDMLMTKDCDLPKDFDKYESLLKLKMTKKVIDSRDNPNEPPDDIIKF